MSVEIRRRVNRSNFCVSKLAKVSGIRSSAKIKTSIGGKFLGVFSATSSHYDWPFISCHEIQMSSKNLDVGIFYLVIFNPSICTIVHK